MVRSSDFLQRRMFFIFLLDLDRTFEDRLEVLVQRLKEYQEIGK